MFKYAPLERHTLFNLYDKCRPLIIKGYHGRSVNDLILLMPLTELCQSVRCHNVDVIVEAAERRPKNVPLLTASNHHSCFDDPFLWSTYLIASA